MMIKGLNLKGLTLFPATEKAIFPCTHKYGAVATWSHCTDQLQTGRVNAEINAFKNNLAVTSFISPYYPGEDVLNVAATGRIGFGIYFPTDYWYNPITHVIEEIPDYYVTAWTQKGVDAGLVVSDQIGVAKTIKTPNHGQQMFDLTSGAYGYDVIHGIPGATDVTSPVAQYCVDWFFNLMGHNASAISYRNGQGGGYMDFAPFFLGARSSAYDYNVDYSTNHMESMLKAMSTRSGDMDVDLSKTRAEVNALCAGYLADAISAGGWYSDFNHWHTSPDSELTDYYASQRAGIGSNDVVTLDVGTAIEYMLLRTMIRHISVFTNGSKMILVTETKDTESLPLNRINTALSVTVDTTGTVLEGKEIKAVGSRGIRKLSTDVYVVEVPYLHTDGFQTVTLEETTTPTYLNFAVPTIVSATKTGNIITVVTNVPTKIVLFSTSLGGALYTANVLKRDNALATTHAIDVTGIIFSNRDTYVGAITSEKQSVLSAKYNF